MMKKDLNEELIRLEMEINKLLEKEQQAISWIVENFDFAFRLCKNSDMTDEEIGKYRKIARKKRRSYCSYAFMCCRNVQKRRL